MRQRRRQKGYTLIELAAAIGLALILAAASAAGILTQIRSNRFTNTVEQARLIAYDLQYNSLSLTSSLQQADGTFQYTYRVEPTFRSVAAFNTTWGTSYPEVTPYGTDYEIRSIANQVPEVRFLVPNNLAPAVTPQNATSSVGPGASTRITVWSEQNTVKRNKVYRSWRVNFMGEDPRY